MKQPTHLKFLVMATLIAGCGSNKSAKKESQMPDIIDPVKLAEDQRFFADSIKPILDKHCLSCHSLASPAEGYEYETYEGSRSNILEGIESIESGEMPPPGYPKVPEAQLEILKSWVGKSY